MAEVFRNNLHVVKTGVVEAFRKPTNQQDKVLLTASLAGHYLIDGAHELEEFVAGFPGLSEFGRLSCMVQLSQQTITSSLSSAVKNLPAVLLHMESGATLSSLWMGGIIYGA